MHTFRGELRTTSRNHIESSRHNDAVEHEQTQHANINTPSLLTKQMAEMGCKMLPFKLLQTDEATERITLGEQNTRTQIGPTNDATSTRCTSNEKIECGSARAAPMQAQSESKMLANRKLLQCHNSASAHWSCMIRRHVQ